MQAPPRRLQKGWQHDEGRDHVGLRMTAGERRTQGRPNLLPCVPCATCTVIEECPAVHKQRTGAQRFGRRIDLCEAAARRLLGLLPLQAIVNPRPAGLSAVHGRRRQA